MSTNEKSASGWERHLQSGLLAILTATALFLAGSVNQQGKAIVRLEAQMTAVQTQMVLLAEATRDRYTEGDASRDLSVRDRQIDSNSARIRALEERLSQ